ncbi:hypothetical protein TrRE_jg9769 [Triparma retinervis]|uniref:Uncharacterized protein n=1 Tax=Triparma retinervis TaxID=2557542 RepID=A0A9W7L1H9_9STRA|nr:hypothetical protein TrRE_jg9769 [Triparma retinervis]
MASSTNRTVECVLEIFYAENKQAHLTIYSDSNPTLMAQEFAEEHSLSERYRVALAQHIRDNLRSGASQSQGSQHHVVPLPTPAAASRPKQSFDDGQQNLSYAAPESEYKPQAWDTAEKATVESEAERSKLWDDLKTAWTDPHSASKSSSFLKSSTNNGSGGPILHKSHASVQARNRSNSGSSDGSKKKKKGKKGKGTPGSYKISRKALKTANRLHNHAATIQKRHEHRKANVETAEKEYLEDNQFSTSKKTRQMAGRRSTFMVNNFSPEMMHQLTVMSSSNNDTSDQDEHVSNVLNDVGSRLHLEAEVKKQKLTKMAELSTFEKQEKEMKGCTFKPQLNSNSKTMHKGRAGKDVFNSLYDQNAEVQNKKAYYDEIAEINSDCTFKPEINVISKEMAELLEISPDPTSPNALPTTEADECTFKPDIGSNKHKPLEEKTPEEFFERLYKEHSAILKRKEDRTANAEKDLFKPQIERSPLNARNVDNLPIHEHLTEQNKKREERHKYKVLQKERMEEEKRNFKVKSERTQNLLRRMKKSSCEELFRVLLATIDFRKNQAAMSSSSLSPKKAPMDVNESFAELVSTLKVHEGEEEEGEGGGGDTITNWKEKTLLPSSCDPTLLDDKVSNLITPLLERHKSYPMSLEYFTSMVMLELERVGVESLDIVRTLRNRARQNRARAAELSKEEPPAEMVASPEKKRKGGKNRLKQAANIIKLFHPSINKKSSQIVMNRSKARAGGDLLFAQLHNAQKHIEAKIQLARKQQEREEDEKCTFKPKLVSKQSAGRYKAREGAA